jgi:hypothetical protein
MKHKGDERQNPMKKENMERTSEREQYDKLSTQKERESEKKGRSHTSCAGLVYQQIKPNEEEI